MSELSFVPPFLCSEERGYGGSGSDGGGDALTSASDCLLDADPFFPPFF